MTAIRKFEERTHLENEKGRIPGFIHLYAGQEACAVGVCMELTEKDYISSTHRGHGHAIAKGCDITAMMHELHARQGGICGGKAGSMHMADFAVGMMGANGIVGAGNPLVCGAALTAKTLKTGGVAVSFMGDGASNQAATLESLNLATVWNLPVIFVVEDNGYAEATPSSWSIGGGDLIKRAEGFGMPGLAADGFDYFAVNEVASKAVARARKGEGPSLIYLTCTRYYGHFEGDAATYRAKGEVERLIETRDCLDAFKARVIENGSMSEAELTSIEAEIAELIENSVKSASADVEPDPGSLTRDVYASY
ncbi:MAG: thiamine pyrophosphate-dependent dehydrogenase E1 component subunit alpha [Rhizobiaceae bacterium]